jgi:subtilisin family serine protease
MIKPDIAAPGVNILSPSLDHGFIQVTGTSAAAAHAAGIAAMLFEWGTVESHYLHMSTQDIKIFMIRGARRRLDVPYPNKDWGYGILDIYNVFDSIRRGE